MRDVIIGGVSSSKSKLFFLMTTAQGASLALCGRERHFLLSDESDFVLTYEDKDGDWMLVGDVPWR